MASRSCLGAPALTPGRLVEPRCVSQLLSGPCAWNADATSANVTSCFRYVLSGEHERVIVIAAVLQEAR